MSGQYSRDHCKIAVGKILQTIGWHSINSTPLEVLTDIFSSYIQQISRTTNDYANEFGQTEANLDHLGLALQEMGINLPELEEYVTYVNFAPPANPAPKFPVPKEDNLNFLKPGSKEVVTRPVYIHEHMPPMYPLLEGSDPKEEESRPIKEECTEETYNSATPFKKPSDISPEVRKPKREDEGSRPTREISSVMMTTSGFLSPAREGKLPEAKAPIPPPVVEVPIPPLVPTAQNGLDPNPKKKIEKRKEKFSKELFKPIAEEKVVKKNASMKDVVKMKQKVAAAAAAAAASNTSSSGPPAVQTPLLPPRLNELKLNSLPPPKMMRDNLDKALAAAKAKTEKLNTTITPIPIPIKAHSPVPQMTKQQVEKLFNEPDRKKINILRKISNVKEGKVKKEPRANTPNIIIDEPSDIVNKISLSSDITIEPIPMNRNQEKLDHYFDRGSPPGTPPTPRTPEIITHSPPVPPPKEKRKRKDNRNKVNRVKKPPRKNPHIPFFTESELVDMIMERPKTPDTHNLNHLRQQLPAHMNLPPMHNPHLPFPFLANFGGPGLIPPQLSTPMFPFSHLANMPNFGKNPYFPPVVPNLPPQIDPMPLVSPKVKEPPPPVEIKPMEVTPQRVQQPPPPLQPIQVPETSSSTAPSPKIPVPQDLSPKKVKEHKKEKKDKIKKKNKKDKVKEKAEKKKIKELKKDAKVKREKKIKKKEKVVKEPAVAPIENPAIPKILLKVHSPSPRPETPEATRKLNIKPIVKMDEEPAAEVKKRDPSPGGLARISALVTGPPKPKTPSTPLPPPVEKAPPEEIVAATPPKPAGRPRVTPMKPKPPPKPKKIEQTFKKTDEQGNEVWICPACGQQDDGRPMIGCDGCDAWYHWVCVGIQVPPDENENWYCKPCLCRKNEDLQTDKKRKRKKKEKKDH